MRKNKLPKSKKVKEAATHALSDVGFSVRQIADILGADKDTICRYKNKELDEEWGRFSDMIKKVYLEQDFEITQLAVKHIKAKINKARFFELVGLFKTVRELQKTATPTTAVQVNFNQHIQKEKEEFLKED